MHRILSDAEFKAVFKARYNVDVREYQWRIDEMERLIDMPDDARARYAEVVRETGAADAEGLVRAGSIIRALLGSDAEEWRVIAPNLDPNMSRLAVSDWHLQCDHTHDLVRRLTDEGGATDLDVLYFMDSTYRVAPLVVARSGPATVWARFQGYFVGPIP